ncbi:MAG: tRNA lysidine(34) synthetase TilS [Frankiales bacterium]|nr:tRNA lysidine(34) synthetase TilS [Frankiales bacterium]
MTGPPAATAAVRLAVRRCLPGGPVAAAVSGGADSLALAAALAHERPGAIALVVDHGLQRGSADVARHAADQCAGLGLDARVLTGTVSGTGEAAARDLRLSLLEASGATVLLGHTRDDQAETVLLGLARGAGARSLAGMPAVRGPFRRPLLHLDRGTVRQACAEAGLTPWEDPHNTDPAYARVRVRREVLPLLETALGPGVAAALARSAAQLREDADALDALTPDTDDCAELAALPAALRARALQRLAVRTCGRAVTGAHVAALRALVEDWHGQGAVGLPGGVALRREGGRLVAALAPRVDNLQP